MNLSDRALFREAGYIDGNWVDADIGATIEGTNPATGEALGRIPDMTAIEARRAVEAARRA